MPWHLSAYSMQMSPLNSGRILDHISKDIEVSLNAQAEREEAVIGRLRVSQEGLVSQLDTMLKGKRSCWVIIIDCLLKYRVRYGDSMLTSP